MSKQSGWGFTASVSCGYRRVFSGFTKKRTEPKLHYFYEGGSLCDGTAPVEIRNFTHPEKSSHACPTCIEKKRALDKRKPDLIFGG